MLSMVGCNNPTQITLQVATDQCGTYPGATVTSIFAGEPGSGIESAAPLRVTSDCGTNGSIGSLVLVPGGSDSGQIEVRVVMGVGAAGNAANPCVGTPGVPSTYGLNCIVQRRILYFVPHQNIVLPVQMIGNGMATSCLGNVCNSDGMADSTCAGPGDANCVSANCELEGNSCVIATAGTGDAGPDATVPQDAPASMRDSSMPDTKLNMPDEGAPSAEAGCDAATGCYQVPPDWTLAGFDPSQVGTCPSNFSLETVVYDPPDAGPSACTPGECIMNAPPTCQGTFTASFFGGIGGCPTAETLGQGCTSTPNFFGAGISAAALTVAAVGGSCTVMANSSVVLQTARACVANPDACQTSAGQPTVCPHGPSAPFSICIVGPADQACPQGWGFDMRHIIAGDAGVVCPSPTCTPTASCTGALDMYQQEYTDGQCNAGAGSIPSDGMCHPLPENSNFYVYAPQGPSNIGCKVGTAAAPIISLNGPQALCCAP
jgi:hypothetical protein